MVLLTPCVALLRADPADEVTLERPPEAFDVTLEAVSCPFAAVSFAASVVEACRREVWRVTKRVCRSIRRGGAAVDMAGVSPDVDRLKLLAMGQCDCECGTAKWMLSELRTEFCRSRSFPPFGSKRSQSSFDWLPNPTCASDVRLRHASSIFLT